MHGMGAKIAGGIGLCIAVCLNGSSCLSMKPLRYTVAMINEGREAILMEPVRLANTSEATVAVGDLLPGGRKSMAPYYCRPAPSVTFAWRSPKTGVETRIQVQLQLPAGFAKDRGDAIVFHVRPEEGVVAVTYELLDPRTGQIRVVRQAKEVSRDRR